MEGSTFMILISSDCEGDQVQGNMNFVDVEIT